MQPQHQSLTLLGEKLKRFREVHKESLAEASEAVEIPTDMLERIEHGKECPSEDVLTLLISHFGVHEQDAGQLWEWAGYGRTIEGHADALQDIANKAAVVLVALDSRVMYTNGASLHADQNGVTLSFSQAGLQQQSVPVARVGMSWELAAQVMTLLQQAVLRKTYLPKNHLLPPGGGDPKASS
jgi:transcriptional regulator with XRE-family HTH domain